MKECMNKRVSGLDYLRAVSMILIVLYRYTTHYQESIGHVAGRPLNISWACFAVNTFLCRPDTLTITNINMGK